MAPRSRGQTLVNGGGGGGGGSGRGEDCAGLQLLLGAGRDYKPDLQQSRRRSSVGFEGYYYHYYDDDQYPPPPPTGHGGNHGEDNNNNRRSRSLRLIKIETAKRYSAGSGRWGDSQESFVLGMNDPNSPSRLSPVSMSMSVSDAGLPLGRAMTAKALLGEDIDEESKKGKEGTEVASK
ncbi:hypothetical protein B0T17DRAFT_538738 [Bombardia bombarda]|uniref:Uncharacterized protein n=1 Tax=Bombardia bombarda TaxID=252184 RepID=A0AA40BVZ2_9PEZI|nr:hypothetical protein B0T17DRAFT_538738 [Bombardia bombarda]